MIKIAIFTMTSEDTGKLEFYLKVETQKRKGQETLEANSNLQGYDTTYLRHRRGGTAFYYLGTSSSYQGHRSERRSPTCLYWEGHRLELEV